MAHILAETRTHTDTGEHMDSTVDEFTEFVCVCRRCQERKMGEREGECYSMAQRGEKNRKHTATNKSRPFANCCILIGWFLESVLNAVHHDRGRLKWTKGDGGRLTCMRL